MRKFLKLFECLWSISRFILKKTDFSNEVIYDDFDEIDDFVNILLFLIAAVSLSNGYYIGALLFYNSKNLNCIGALFF